VNLLTASFLIALAAQTGVRLWLSSRQLSAAGAARDSVPAAFRPYITPEDQARAADYTAAKIRLSRWSLGLDVLLTLALTLGGGMALVAAAVSVWPITDPWRGMVLVIAVFAFLQLAALPLSVYGTFGIEARFGFNRTTPGLFVKDVLKEWTLGLALGAPVLLAVLLLMQKGGARWWVYAWLAWLAFSLTVTWMAPRFIAPLFNKFSPLGDAGLKARLLLLCQRCNFAADGGLFVMDASLRSAHGNAYFTGIGRNKRIVLFDTLLSHLEHAEIEAVLAHELGHFKLHHVRQQLILGVIVSFAGFALLGWLAALPQFYAAFRVPPSAAAALLLCALAAPAFTYFVTPLRSWWSRRHEFEADRFAAQHADAAKLIDALVKLNRDNASVLSPDPLYSAFYYSHPPTQVRISRLTAPAAGDSAA
jgi:STE24 endopeptidase